MEKKLLVNFLKDRLVFILFYLFNISCVIIFFHIIEPANTEIVYPLSISLFLLLIYLVIDLLKYYPFNKAIKYILDDQITELQPQTNEQQLICRVLKKNKANASKKYHQLKEKNDENLYFLSHFMHYLKTPVSVITLMISKEKNNEDSLLLKKIGRENKRIHTSIDQALTMVRIEGFENDLEIRAIDLESSIRELINERKKECIYHTIYPTIECQVENAMVVTDKKWCKILLDQIISNAIKYSSLKEGNKKLLFKMEQSQQYLRLSIIDEGMGIPSYDIESVFNAFFTGENGRKMANSSGIGLYICKKIADKLGHRLSIQSEESIGTTVTIDWQKANQL